MMTDIKKVPDSFSGMFFARGHDGRIMAQYWVFGKGYYYRYDKGLKVVYHRGKRLGLFENIKDTLRRALKASEQGDAHETVQINDRK